MGYCPQFDALLPYLTGYETLQLFARLRGIQEGLLNTEIDQLLSDLKLTDLAHVLVSRYSGGNRRKLSVAIALVGETPLICLDEPTTGVDPISRRHIWNLLLKYRRQGRTLVLSSHRYDTFSLCFQLFTYTYYLLIKPTILLFILSADTQNMNRLSNLS